MRPALKEAMLVLFPVPHWKHMNSMCFKCSINRDLAAYFSSQASQQIGLGMGSIVNGPLNSNKYLSNRKKKAWPVRKKLDGLTSLAVQPAIWPVQYQFDHKTVHWAGSNQKGHRSTVRPVRSADPVRFLKHCYKGLTCGKLGDQRVWKISVYFSRIKNSLLNI